MTLAAEEKIASARLDIDILPAQAPAGLYAAVLLDVQIKGLKDRLFTYAIPERFRGSAFIGAQVLVPFGRQMLAGYIVGVSDRHDLEKSPKDIHEVIEPEPLFDEAYIDYLAYVAKKYCATLQDVVAAAIPACLQTKMKRLVRLTEAALPLKEFGHDQRTIMLREMVANHFGDRQLPIVAHEEPAVYLIFDLLLESAKGILSLSTLRQRFEMAGRRRKPKLTITHFQKGLAALSEAGLLVAETVQEGATEAKTRRVLSVGAAEAQTEKQRSILQALLAAEKALSVGELVEKAGTSRSTIDKMIAASMLVVSEEDVVRDGLSALPQALVDKNRTEPPLTDEQTLVFARLQSELQAVLAGTAENPVQPWLLHGVTGSGKTEIYLRLISEVLKMGRTALFLVPEISLTPQLAGRLKGRFGKLVAVWHSGISPGERYDTFQRLRNGDVKVLLGARSAILAHIPDLALIVLDEEHDSSYKQTSPAPRYHARHLAEEKARRAGAMVLLGSATPDLVSFYEADRAGRVLTMPSRVFKQAMPKVTIVDMRKQFKDGHKTAFSEPLTWAVGARLERKEQIVLLINRRGFASHVFCQVCGHVVKCKNCSVSLVLHQKGLKGVVAGGERSEPLLRSGYLACHHCGFRSPLMSACTACASPFLKESGLGTQKVEEDVHKLFPAARVVRLDSDVAAKKGAYEQVLSDFSQGRADILIGTQMVAKGLDIENVTLVGVLTADAAFNMPDYRSMERGFQLLTQVAGRAGRGAHAGEVILQTYAPDLEALRLASDHDFEGFYRPELAGRQLFQYPPFSQLIRLVVSSEDAGLAESVCEMLAEEVSRLLEDRVGEEDVRILGPTACLLEKVKTKYRFHLLIKNLAGPAVQYLITEHLRLRRFGQDVNVAVDVDALDLI
ncbi:MAG: primosomal protein N' [Cyanobacteria bacterium REEB67]|nr:primosomal protein N' [Cyanobacteria bacterium REEB67]